MTRLRERLAVRHLAAFTTGLTFTLILLGVYTAAYGAGLSCSAQWPLCDGGVLPQSIPSFVEWFHRLVAMVAGFFVLGTVVGAYRSYSQRRIRWSALGALLLLPTQMLLGGATVIVYTPTVQTAHHGFAMLIFAGLLASTLWMYEVDVVRPRAVESAADAGTEDETAATTGDRRGVGSDD